MAKDDTVTLKDIATMIAQNNGATVKDTTTLMQDFVSEMTRNVAKGRKVRIVGLGIFEVRKRAARMGRNPATGEEIQIAASRKIAFRPSKEFKESV